MLGREATLAMNEGKSGSSGSSFLKDSDKDSFDDEDDDSPYFVKITLDSWFLSHLQEPSIVSSHEIDGNY